MSNIDLYNWNGIKYPTVINNNNYALFERKNLEIVLVVLYVSVDIKPFIVESEVKVIVYKSIKQSWMPKYYDTIDKLKPKYYDTILFSNPGMV